MVSLFSHFSSLKLKAFALTKVFGCLLVFIITFYSATIQAATAVATDEINADDQDHYTLIVENAFVELHSGPGRGYPVINVITKGEVLTVLLKRTHWLKVTDKRGDAAWLNIKSLKQVATTTQESVTILAETLTTYHQRDFEFGVMYGDFDGDELLSLHGAYVFNDLLATEITLGKALGDVSDAELLDVSIISQPFPQWLVTPYVGVGAGLINTRPQGVLADTEKREDTLLTATAGLRYYVGRNFILKAEYKLLVALTEENNNKEINTWKLGFSAFF